MKNELILRLRLDPAPCSEMIEQIEDLVASTLARHGYAGHIESSVTGNTTAVQYRPRVDDGRGYPRANTADDPSRELSTALRRVLAYLAIHDSQYYTINADALKARALLERLNEPGARDGEREFTFVYRDGEMAARVFAVSLDAAWEKLSAVIRGSTDTPAGVLITAEPARTLPEYWAAVESDEESADEDPDDWEGREPDDPIVPAGFAVQHLAFRAWARHVEQWDQRAVHARDPRRSASAGPV